MSFWDKVEYKSDYETVSKDWNKIEIQYHYSWMESQICKYLKVTPGNVFDIGSGYGHWMKFYERLGSNVVGLEKSKVMAKETGSIHGDITDYCSGYYDVVNAIGVLHHIMKDKDLIWAIDSIKRMADDLIFIGTRFDFFDSPKEKYRKYRPLKFWEKHLNIIGIERNNPGLLNKHLDLIVAKKL